MSDNDPKLQDILKQLARFDFQFYAKDENGIPLVKGPNGQVVEINVAINFVNKQIEEQKNNSSGSMEMPNIPENIDTNVKAESAIETSIEDSVESQEDKKEKNDNNNQQNIQTPTAPKVAPRPVKKIKPYGDGFDPKSFNPSDLKSTLNFVEKNSKISKTSSNKWLAEQFKKFVAEFNAGVNKN